MPVLIHEMGPLKGQTFRIEADRVYTFGREGTCDLPLDDELVSRLHARLRGKDGRYFLKDNHSSNGTFVNDQPIAPMRELQSGDKLSFGGTILTFLSDADAGGGAGKTLGGYKLLQRLGRGGMGTVYRALQLSLNREVALKILSPELSQDPAFVQRFLKEARSAGQLNHPNIVQVYDVDRDEGLTFYAMEFVAGGTVEDLIREHGRVDLDRTLGFLEDAARGLQYAEMKKIVHRDIKPDNLMLTEMGTLKVADLGLALALHEGTTEKTILGTPHFISPEQALGLTLDTRSDLYSLGTSFYRLLTGNTMYHGSQAEEIVRQQVKAEPPKIRDSRPEVPESVEQLFQKLVRKDPNERYQTCAELLEELAAIRAATGWHRRTFVVGAVLALAVAATLYFLLRDDGEVKGTPAAVQVVDSSQTDALAGKVAEQSAELEQQRLENDALSARMQLDQGSDQLSRDELLAALNELAKKYDGTVAAQAAREQASQIAGEIEAERQAAMARAEQVGAAVERMEAAVAAALAEGRFADALLAVHARGDALADVRTDARLEMASSKQLEEVRRQADAAVNDALTAARAALSASDFDQAREGLRETAALLLGGERVPEEFSSGRDLLESMHRSVGDLLAETDNIELQHQRALLAADLHLIRTGVDWSSCYRLQRNLKFAEALSLVEDLQRRMTTEEYRLYLSRRVEDLRLAAGDFDRFVSALSAGTLLNDEIPHPERNTKASIKELAREGDGILLKVTRSVGTASSVVRFDAFDSLEKYLELMDGRVERTPEQLLGMIRGGLAVAAANAHVAVAAVGDQIRAYEPALGWTVTQQQALAGLKIPTCESEKLDLLIDSILRQKPALKEAVSLLRERIAREERALRLFEEALQPFGSESPVIHFQEAAGKLEKIVNSYRGTDLFLVAYELFDSGRADIPLVD
ncbi:MAG: protein kinase [Planctomycetota bacterium]